jgi:UTP-glucose-1-phosphate uridylyltransferase
MKIPTLVILAAGMGSRYGGLKQIDALGDNGETIIDFSIYDAIKAGFKKLILIIKEEHEQAFETQLVSKIRPFIDVQYAYQRLEDVPQGIEVPEGREKPWGTVHALLAIEEIVGDNPFTVMNADDFYGRASFEKMYDFLSEEVNDDNYSMIGYVLKNTLTDHGSVTRGVCEIKDDYLDSIVEIQQIEKNGNKVRIKENNQWKEIDGDGLVSMNYWGFTPHIFSQLKPLFKNYLDMHLASNPMKAEYVIPTAIGELLEANEVNVKVIASPDQWHGVTYQEDKDLVISKLKEYKTNKLYPHDLWKQK